jgi:hypothetical protein
MVACLLAGAALYLPLLLLDCYWNLSNWHPRLDWPALVLFVWLLLDLALLRLLLRKARTKIPRAFAFVICLLLLALGLYALPAEPLSTGLFARQAPSPWWYRGARLILLALPALWWWLSAGRIQLLERPKLGAA